MNAEFVVAAVKGMGRAPDLDQGEWIEQLSAHRLLWPRRGPGRTLGRGDRDHAVGVERLLWEDAENVPIRTLKVSPKRAKI